MNRFHRKLVAQGPKAACKYALGVIRGRYYEAEETIARDPEQALLYAEAIIGGRWSMAEKYIAKNHYCAGRYIHKFGEQIKNELADPNHKLTPIDAIMIKNMMAKNEI